MRLELSTSPRSIWVWAADEDGVEVVLEVLAAAGDPGTRVSGRTGLFRIVDVPTGVRAYAALGALAAAGHTFAWHPSQRPADQRPHLYDVEVAPPRDS